ncbi:MAG: DUF2283 domain-containing protein [Gemmatimonadetes bacterium]|nr:DUF2283 domain-containing protein [Gemmatimonadota bacterium]
MAPGFSRSVLRTRASASSCAQRVTIRDCADPSLRSGQAPAASFHAITHLFDPLAQQILPYLPKSPASELRVARSKSSPPPKAPEIRRKTIRIDQLKLDVARRLLGVSTETAAVNAALDLVVFRGEVFEGIDRLSAQRRSTSKKGSDVDALAITVAKGGAVAQTRELADGILADFDARGVMLSLEILDARRRMGEQLFAQLTERPKARVARR